MTEILNESHLLFPNYHPEIQKIESQLLKNSGYHLAMLREDRIHTTVSGNKFRKLKYNLLRASETGRQKLLTFGGAFSNHIAAVAAAGKEFGFETIGVIRGEELEAGVSRNTTLNFAQQQGMVLHFVSREDYRKKEMPVFIDGLKNLFGDFYLLPEGGTNTLAVQGCEEMLTPETVTFDYLCVPVGTGGTISGLVKASEEHQTVIGFSALKGNFQTSEVEKHCVRSNFRITDDYCFGGYAKIDSGLVRFINDFKNTHGIPLDPVYTGKMMYGIMEMVKNKEFKENSRILAVHTGGLQGIHGMNELLKRKNLPQIE
ncbi:MAG: pyridoxal-phosphate dependent enzyme [Bacteroidota bacterium]